MKILPLSFLLFGLVAAVPLMPAVAQDANAPATRPAPDAAVPDVAVQGAFDGLIGAIADDNYAGFLLFVDENFRVALTKPAFEGVVRAIGPRLNSGYEATYLGQLKKSGYDVHLWKVGFKTGDDLLAEMSIKDGVVGGFVLR